MCRRTMLSLALLLPLSLIALWTVGGPTTSGEGHAVHFARFQAGPIISYGILEGDRLRSISGDLFGTWQKTDTTYALSDVKLLAPTVPTKVLAVAGNYRSHMGNKPDPVNPEIFFMAPSSISATGENIVIPPGTEKVDYEAEFVIVIGKRAKNVSVEKALDYVLGITCGNDVSARDWQKGDVQWWRAKGSDTFGPCGPYIVSAKSYDDLVMRLRHNGEQKQEHKLKDMIHGPAVLVSFVSKYMTLEPGDLIFTGTSGTTQAINAGDIVEVEIDGHCLLKNGVELAK